ncbi:MAG: hypothetical protein M1824_004479 [Vezdaea acicularis]|nr:MAG: hypothetical protein M1824_004479 [Vezdaea acicularis]
MEEEDEEYFIPLIDQRVFGAGIKRKRVQFVPSKPAAAAKGSVRPRTTTTARDRYLSIVLPTPDKVDELPEKPGEIKSKEDEYRGALCEICRLPLSTDATPHEASLIHQACLEHSHPPSHLDRSRKGLQYLSSYGWDPDSRLGLGAEGTGTRIPIKTTPKNDNLGIGVDPALSRVRSKVVKKRLGAKEIRMQAETEKKKAEKLREIFYRNEDTDKYLGKLD